jgi:DNA helicase-2/ATP-dependent DNA helicase PcrA
MKDFVSWTRILSIIDGIGPKTAEKIMEQVAASPSLDRLDAAKITAAAPKRSHETLKEMFLIFDDILKTSQSAGPAGLVERIIESPFFQAYLVRNFTNIDERADDCRQFASFVEGFDSIPAVLDELSLVTSGEDYYNGKSGIVLSSIHQAKGLEWKVVFIIWLCEGKFPVYQSTTEHSSLEEERRLFYVAVTRAKDRLYLSFPRVDSRNQHGYERYIDPSRFVMEIPPHLYKEADRFTY